MRTFLLVVGILACPLFMTTSSAQAQCGSGYGYGAVYSGNFSYGRGDGAYGGIGYDAYRPGFVRPHYQNYGDYGRYRGYRRAYPRNYGGYGYGECYQY